ncbi:hypothetical protein ACHHYP_10350 [Achlya hypogyna]|uniref:Prolyl 4-hydroxylase alpha subunit Fe(2+) 2OG dioxygenase domain-containing protein n=1 Tax=Achlya hypogyna TaxID=1202772 RepID=A0A1V9YLN6_ACHHY|nr:hypothetical protein ACHHYP_10350 [Achlya hypogyna]
MLQAMAVEDEANGNAIAEFREIVQSIISDGTFAVGGRLPATFPWPRLEVEGVGRLAFPLCAEQAATLKAVCTPSPFGRGHATIVDPAVRRSVEADADRVRLSAEWATAVTALAQTACESLGLSFAVDAHLYKMLYYETGDFFLEHQDTEKEPGMFEHFGGHLDVRHLGERKRFGLDGPESADALHYAAFFADVHHEVQPVTAGRRLILAYNLVRRGGSGGVAIPSNVVLVQRARAAADRWQAPAKLLVELDHEYTATSARFAMLKGRDRALVRTLQETQLLDLHLVTLVKSRSRYDYDDEDDDDEDDGHEDETAEMEDILAESTTVDGWVNERDEAVTMDVKVDVRMELLRGAADIFADMEPTNRSYEGFMGNYGPTLEFTYRRTLLVVWPRTRSLEIAGVSPALALAQTQKDAGDMAAATATLARIAAFAKPPTLPQLALAVECAAAVSAVDVALAFLRVWASRASVPPPPPSFPFHRSLLTPTPSASATLVPAIAAAVRTFGWTTAVRDTVVTSVVQPLGVAGVIELAAAAQDAPPALLAAVDWRSAVLPLSALVAAIDLAAAGFVVALELLHLVAAANLSYADLAVLVEHSWQTPTSATPALAVALAQRPPDARRTASVAVRLLATPAAAPVLVQTLVANCRSPHDTVVPDVLAVARAVASSEAYQALARFRLSLLPGDAAAPPPFSWCQPTVELLSHPQVQAFLRGPTERMTECGFNGIAHARNFAAKYFDGRVNAITGASANATPLGTGKNARCDIVKTQAYHDAATAAWHRHKREAEALRQLLMATAAPPSATVVVDLSLDD